MNGRGGAAGSTSGLWPLVRTADRGTRTSGFTTIPHDVPDADPNASMPLHHEEGLADLAPFVGYIGHGASVAKTGTWTLFLAGD